jgi:DNA-binding MarR family transcriptional regulator
LDALRSTTLSKLAEHMGVDRATMSSTVFRLVRAGYIARRADRQDRRMAGLTLTRTGKRIQEQNTALNPARVRQMLRMMRPDEAERALAGIERMAQAAAIILKRRKRERDG